MNRKYALMGLVLGGFLFALLPGAQGQTTSGDEGLFTGAVKPNVLIVLDNSNSMDEDFFGNAVGSWSPDSKAAAGRRALTDLVNTYAGPMRIGLMTYRLPSVDKSYISNSPYFVSYDPRSYCPTPVDACVEYCRTGDDGARIACQSACIPNNSQFDAHYIDDSISILGVGSTERNKYCALAYPKTNRMINPTDTSNYIYYRQALPYYSSSDEGIHFDVSPSYAPDESITDVYEVYSAKTGTSDGTLVPANEGYSGPLGSGSYLPTGSDIALGYRKFGKRLAFIPVGRTWYANTSPGGGYLQVAVDDNQANNQQRNKLLAKLTAYENDPTGYMDTCTESDRNQCPYIINAGLTPTAGTLQAVISYFQGGSTFPTPIQANAADCQRSFIVYVTDGLPSVDENGVPGDADSLMPAVVSRLQALRSLPVTIGGKTYTYDLRTYIVGMGLTSEAKARLDQMAVAAGTDINGHAYYADSAEELQGALNQIFTDVVSGTYSFSLPSVSSVRFEDENSLYAASFAPLSAEPFWKGQLQKIQILTDGSLGNVIWEAGTVLEGTSEESRNLKTLIGGALRDFTESISPVYFGLSTSKTQERNQIVGYIRGKSTLPLGEAQVPNPDSPRKLGDIFHANPMTISSPSLFFNDPRDENRAFMIFRNNHQRTSADGRRIIIAGANDGQLHAFETGGGTERWSFIPPNLLAKLKDLAHVSHPTTKKHQYFVDGPISAADVWLPTIPFIENGTHKFEWEWRTLLVFGLGMGVRDSTGKPGQLWSKDRTCDSQFKNKYSPAYRFYCGYYALDVTDTTSFPQFRWMLDPGWNEAPYLGEPWSKMVMGRVKINGKERWVGFIGGGYSLDPKEKQAGRGFFIVDLWSGNVLWSFTAGENNNMSFIPGTPAIVDKDNDGFIDTAYVGDLAGNLWKFTFCPNDPLESQKPQQCGLADWSASILYFSQEDKLPVFTTPAVAKDKNDFWVFWGTGDKAYPNVDGPQNKFFAIRDDNPEVSYTLADLQNITSGVFNDSAKKGWYLNLSGQERVLSDAAVFKGIVLFTSYTPPVNQENMCGATGVGALYGIAMLPLEIGGTPFSPGQGVLNGQRKIDLGAGIPSAPVVSQKPIDSGQTGGTPDVYLAVSGGAGLDTQIRTSGGSGLPGLAAALAGSSPASHLIHWRDRRVQPY